MMARCYRVADLQYKDWGGRGIKVCERWHDFELYYEDIASLGLGFSPVGLTLDRIDNDGNYEPGNVRWATFSEQMHNRRKPKKKIYATVEEALAGA
jgi:hypothetical protein